ncbi:general secretion pathway protein GspK [Rhodopila sp.]|uniref:general secretion pathway protein GspK n=1 Tax=Rhodopila sp. TaxID=2480087 RepID=UPI003D129E76
MNRGQRGFALLIVLWTMGLLALLGTQIVAAGRSDTQLADNLKQAAVLAAAADGAVADVMFHMQAAADPRLRADGVVHQVRIGQTAVLVRIENETDRVNLNTASGDLLKSLIIQVGGPPALADRLAAAILDWHTENASPRQGGAKAADYRAGGRNYGPPGTPFQSVHELTEVLGMTADLYARLAPHLTVLSDDDPDMSSRDPIVARALSDASGVADDAATSQATAARTADEMLRIHATALGPQSSRYSIVVVASANFRNASPRVNILLRQRVDAVSAQAVASAAGAGSAVAAE